MRIVHTADWQIGRVFADPHGPDDDGRSPAGALHDARFAAVESIARLADSHGADIVLVAGDVFDQQALSDATLRRLVNAMSGFSGHWLLLPGNHDASLAESVWTRLERLQVLPGNIRLALHPETHEYPDLQLAVLAAPLTQRQTHDDLTAPFDHWQTPPGWFRVGMAHGSVDGILPAAADSPNPIAADRAQLARLDYLALGDWHGLKQIDERTWYSGTPEPDRFVANEPGHVLLVDIAAPGALPQVSSHRVATYCWHALTMEVHGRADVEQLATQLAPLASPDVVKLKISGSLDVAASDDLERELDVLRARLHVLQVDLRDLHLAPTLDDLAALQLDGVLAHVADDLKRLQQGDADVDPHIAAEALKVLVDLVRREGRAA